MKCTITIAITVDDFSQDEAPVFAKALAENLTQVYGTPVTVVKVRPATPTRAYPGERHEDCGQMVSYGGALLHQC